MKRTNPFEESTMFSCPKCDRDAALELRTGKPTGNVWCDVHGEFPLTEEQKAALSDLATAEAWAASAPKRALGTKAPGFGSPAHFAQMRKEADSKIHEFAKSAIASEKIFRVECLSCGDLYMSASVNDLDIWMQMHKKGDRR